MGSEINRRELLGKIGVCASAAAMTQCLSKPLSDSAGVASALGSGASDGGHCGEPDPASYLDWNDPAAWSGELPSPMTIVTVSQPIRVSGTVTVGGIFIEEAGALCFDAAVNTTVMSRGNVVVRGRLIMKPESIDVKHTLQFVGSNGAGVDESTYAGGSTMEVLTSDVGLWIEGCGVLDARGTPRAGWNRTGNDATWDWEGNVALSRARDTIIQAPIAPGTISTFPILTAPITPPSVTFDGRTYYAETFNVTRNVEISGMAPTGTAPNISQHRAHVMFLHCVNRQYIEYASFRYLAPLEKTGRYALHFHHCAEGVRGTVVRGVVAQDCGGHAFVAHASRGITFDDCIAYQTRENAYWWDFDAPGQMINASHDIIYRHCAAFKGNYKSGGFLLGQGTGNECIDCVVVGSSDGSTAASGFFWQESSNFKPNVWRFTDCVSHNNAGNGLRVWQNDDSDHMLENFTAFHNNLTGVRHGAYGNRYRYRNIVSFHNNGKAGATSHAQSAHGGIITWERLTLGAENTYVFAIVDHVASPQTPQRLVDCRFLSGTGTPVQINEAAAQKPGAYDFIRTAVGTEGRELEPSDFAVTEAHLDSRFRVERRDGTCYELKLDPAATPPALQMTPLASFTLSNAMLSS
jgi:hypothetical protein